MAISDRNSRLDQLRQLTIKWADTTTKQLQDRVDMLNRLTKGRGAGQLADSSVQAASGLVVTKLEEFLVG